MKSFSFVHLADIHLGYAQYNLTERSEDFARTFREAVDKIVNLKPAFAVFSGDIFDSPRPSNLTLATAIREFKRLRDFGIKVFAVDGSHDLEPNITTGTVLVPLHSAGLIYYLPKMDGGCWQDENCYIYGVQSCRSIRESEDKLAKYLADNPPKPKADLFNIYMFHGALDEARYTPQHVEPDVRTELMPEKFNYYAGGHVHKPSEYNFRGGILVYPGCLETTMYTEANIEKGFYHVQVNSLEDPPTLERIRIETARKFIVKETDFSGETPEKIVAESSKIISDCDREGAVLVLVLTGTLPLGVRKSQLDIPKIKSSAKKAVYTAVANKMTEVEWLKTLQIKEARELKTAAYEYLLRMFKQRLPEGLSLKLAWGAVDILDPVRAGDEEAVKSILEELARNDHTEVNSSEY